MVRGTPELVVPLPAARRPISKDRFVVESSNYVDGRKLHLLDDTGKEHVIEITKQIMKDAPFANNATTTETPSAAAKATLEVVSTPSGADIELDGTFVGNTPSSLSVTQGDHTLRVSKKGYGVWERKLRTTSGVVRISPELQPIIFSPKQSPQRRAR